MFSTFNILHSLILSCNWRPQNSLPNIKPSAIASYQAVIKPACRWMGSPDLTNFLQAIPWLRITASRRTWILSINHISSISQYISCQVPILSTNTPEQQLDTLLIMQFHSEILSANATLLCFNFEQRNTTFAPPWKRSCMTVGVPHQP